MNLFVRMMRTLTVVFILSILCVYLAGCGDKFLDPTQVGRFRPVPAVNVILDSLGVAEETPSTWAGAEEPKPIDALEYEKDYVFGTGDVVRISIFELLQEGVAFERDYIVTETGKIVISEVGAVQAAGLTESQLKEEVENILTPSILKEPAVTVTLLNSEQRQFSIFGEAVRKSGRYPIPRYDFRLADAISIAGGISQFNVSYIYVTRAVTGKETVTGAVEPKTPELAQPAEQPVVPEKEMLEIIAPRAQRKMYDNRLVITSAEMITQKELAQAALPDGFEPLAGLEDQNEIVGQAPQERPAEVTPRETIEQPIVQQESERIEWVFQDGRWVPVQVGRPKTIETPLAPKPERITMHPLKEKAPEEFGWEEIGTGGVQTRVIEIPADKLRGGDPKYNIVIRPGDSIHVPVDVIGEYFIYGNTNRQGAVDLTGRPITLKMAIAAAGGLGPLAWPKRCEVIRRIGKDKEEIVMVDMDKIFSGEQPDFFIKPLDTINVGTHPSARWRAVLRNAFRATYGFGFIYDRNFADRDYGTSRPFPNWSF